MKPISYDLRNITQRLVHDFPEILCLHLFGSRRYGTMSTRSDCDILVTTNKHIPPNQLRDFALKVCPALDLFLVNGAKAISCINDSYVQAATYDKLIEILDCVKFWENGLLDAEIIWEMNIHAGASFVPTSLPNTFLESQSLQAHMKNVSDLGLSICPYIGDTPDKISAFITDVAERMILRREDLGPRGQARAGWSVNLQSEYDFQNLFYSVVKPWLPGLGREEVVIIYDGQDKKSDFNLFGNKIILELKFIKDANSKASIAKTLEGLANFYANNANVRVLIILILVKTGTVELDGPKWEADFTYFNRQPRVITKVLFCE
jgi:hypothetical protein